MTAYITTRLELLGRMLRRIFCRHQWEKIGYRQEVTNAIRYPIRTYRCKKCETIRFTDGRNDPYEKIATIHCPQR